MPGLMFTLAAPSAQYLLLRFGGVQETMKHSPVYQQSLWISRPELMVGHVAYPEYPVRFLDCNRAQIYLEGRVYGKSWQLVEQELRDLSIRALDHPEDAARYIEGWTSSTHGSYLVLIFFPSTAQVLMYSDAFCRLPLYYYVNTTSLIVAREPKFILRMNSDIGFDRIGCAEELSFGTTLGERTLWEGIKSFPDAGFLRARPDGDRISVDVRSFSAWNLDEESPDLDVSRHCRDFVDLFVAACRDWGSHPDASRILVSLSGGHDSRMVAAGLKAAGMEPVSVTYRDPTGTRDGEIRCAQQVAGSIGIPWHRVDLPAPTASDVDRLVYLKDGLNWSSMAYILAYLDALSRTWGRNSVYLTGDGGDDCLKVMAPAQPLTSIDDLVDHVLAHFTYVPWRSAEAILKLTPATLRSEIHDLLDRYPERDLSRRVKHFLIFERGRRCYFEGEDRTRFFMWESSPFYSPPLFSMCMRVPDTLRRHNEFCRKAMMLLSPAAARVAVEPIGLAPAGLQYRLYQRARHLIITLPPLFQQALKAITRRPTPQPHLTPPEDMQYLLSEFRAGPLAQLLSASDALRQLQAIDRHGYSNLWNIVALEKLTRATEPRS